MSSSHTLKTTNVIKGVAQQWKEGKLCDVKLNVYLEGRTIPAHKTVLAAASGFFNSMFLGYFKESKYNEITLIDVAHAG